ncbi:unnamed protein product [Adineta steineri]|uniref:Uncharacterized protein n=2 Tax=Adineta steineri TaxID=433720 RepID=A0A819W6U2_9BILA|nr:unnamed protein product [Adineta steineri]
MNLSKCSEEYLIILLDSIDQLEVDAYDCQWLPELFPTNVKCIVSTLPGHGNILSNLKRIINYNSSLPNDTEHILVSVPPFEVSTVDIVYTDWLVMKQRSLNNEQRIFIRELMGEQTEILPLYMKLIFDIISSWHSYDPIDTELKNLKTVDHCIRYLFDHLKTVHNSILFHRAICYMTACRNGISQNELEDVLSLDDDVLKSVFEHYIPPIRRLPGILWTRIRNDLDEYITEKEVDNSSVIYWYHRRFIEVANTQYISRMNSDERSVVFQNMVDLYKETWKGKNKPFKIDDPKLVKKYNLNESNGEIQANRFITSQPIEFIDDNGCVQFNKRKLNELPQFLSQLTNNLAIPIAADEIFFNYSFMRAKIACSSFNDIMEDFEKFKHSSSYRLSPDVIETKKELDIFISLYLIIGVQVQEHPDNYSFEVCSRLLSLFSIKPHITNLIKQFDEQSIRYCSLIVPYCQLQPPGSGLIYSMNIHTASIVEMDFTDDQMVLISLSDKITVTDMEATKVVLNINLPTLDEPYLNSTTFSEGFISDGNNGITNNLKSRGKTEDFQQYHFLVNSLHHIYFVSAHENIKFERSSKVGYLTVEILHKRHALCIIAERKGNSVECWNLVKNQLFDRIDFSKSIIKNVLCVPMKGMIVTVLQDGTIHIHSIIDWMKSSFIHRGSIHGGSHLDLVVVDGPMLITTFDASVPIDFAVIGLQQFQDSEQTLSDNQVLKTLITFDPPIAPKPIKSIILPNKEAMSHSTKHANFPLFMCKTTNYLYVVHKCNEKDVSYVRINGLFDIVSTHAKHPHTIYTARGGIIELYKWKCHKNEDNDGKKNTHTCQLYVSIDISASTVTSIKASSEYANAFLCSMENGAIHAYFASHARKAYKSMPFFPRTNQVIRTVQLLEKTAVTLDDLKRELTTWSYQHSSTIESTRLFLNDITVNEFVIASSILHSQDIFVLIFTNNYSIEIYSATSLNRTPLFSLHLRSPASMHSTSNGIFYAVTCKGIVYTIVQQITAKKEIEFNQKSDIKLKIQCSMMFSSILTLDGLENFIVLADNGQSMAICSMEKIIYIDINLSPYVSSSSSQLKSITSDLTGNDLLLYFNNKSLILNRVNLNKSNDKDSIHLTSFNQVDKFCLKKHCLVIYNKEQSQLNLHNIHSSTPYQSIQLNNECQYLCLNESATYVFVLIKARMLFMYRIGDGRQLAKLYAYDFVSYMIADNDFLVLAMNDRRLLTLMIADPDDSTVQAKIQALPSRTIQRLNESATAKLIEHIEKTANMKSDDEGESDLEEKEDKHDRHSTNKNVSNTSTQIMVQPASLFRCVTRLNGRHSLSKMSGDEEIRSKVMNTWTNISATINIAEIVDDSDNENHDDDNDVESPGLIIQNEQEQHVNTDLSDIHQKVLEYDQQQLKGIQFANAGDGNLRVVNSYAVNSNTCIII